MLVVLVSVLLGFEAWSATASSVGTLTFEACTTSQGAAGCVNLPGSGAGHAPVGVAISPSGHALYVAASDRVEHFFVGADGALAYDGCISNDGSGGFCADIPGTGTPLAGAASVAVSPDGASVYVASSSGTVSHFFAATGGQLTWDGCVSNDGSGGSCADIPGTGAPLNGADGIAVSKTGAVYVTGSDANTVSHFFAAPQGQITWDGCLSDDGSQGCGDIPGDPFVHPRDVVVSPDGTSVYVASADSATISHFFAATGGQLTWDGCVSDDGSGGYCADIPGTGTPLDGANGVAVSADGRSVYVASFLAGTVSHLFAAPQGQLTWDGCVSDDGSGGLCAGVPGSTTPLAGASEVAVSPDGSSAYVTADGTSTIVAFTTPSTGQLTYQGCDASGGGNGCAAIPGGPLVDPYGIAVSPDGRSVYASATGSASLTHFVRVTTSTSGGGTGGAGGGAGGGGTGGGGGANGGGSTTKTIPVLTSLAIKPFAFSAALGGPTEITSPTSRKGALITYQLNVAATVHFVVEHAVPGRTHRVNGKRRCQVPTHANARGAECVRFVSAGDFAQTGKAGANSVRFSGRIDGTKLLRGSYRLIATAKTAITGHAVSVTFKIKR